MNQPVINCKHFSGYKPCGLNPVCDAACTKKSVVDHRILFLHLEALGAVLRSTGLLDPIKKKYPNSHITWVTKAPAQHLLKNLKEVDQVLTLDQMDLLQLHGRRFDVVFVVDKSRAAIGILNAVHAERVYGFKADPYTGAILPCTEAAQELWRLGLSDHDKFYVNKKSELQLATEALELPYSRSEYKVELSHEEKSLAHARRSEWLGGRKRIVGLNTGCANVIPYKKLSVKMHRSLIPKIQSQFGCSVVLLGGREDAARNIEIADGLDVICTPTDLGLRDGLVSMEACDVIITGDSLGMHMAIGLKKWVVAWFGPTCDHEIDLFDRGVRVRTKATCSPCWKRSCQKDPMCYDLVEESEIIDAVAQGLSRE